jgi:hypothetical protein
VHRISPKSVSRRGKNGRNSFTAFSNVRTRAYAKVLLNKYCMAFHENIAKAFLTDRRSRSGGQTDGQKDMICTYGAIPTSQERKFQGSNNFTIRKTSNGFEVNRYVGNSESFTNADRAIRGLVSWYHGICIIDDESHMTGVRCVIKYLKPVPYFSQC